MGLRIATNIAALAGHRYLAGDLSSLNSAQEKLASGRRINHAADDAAGLAVSEKLRATIRSLKQAGRNAHDGISLAQTLEGSLQEVGNIMIRLRELSIEAASDTIGSTERGFLDKEVQQLKAEVERIADTTEFNGHKLLNGSEKVLEIQVGTHDNPNQDRLKIDLSKQVNTPLALGISHLNVRTKDASREGLAQIDFAINELNKNRASIGAFQNRLNSAIRSIQIYGENLSAARSRIMDTDYAAQTTEATRASILSHAATAVLTQANSLPESALKLL